MTFKSEVNDKIRAYNVRVIDENGNQKGIMDLRSALKYAGDLDLDLVKIADGNPAVCRVVNANKFFYEQKKQQQAAEKKQRESTIVIKEVQLRPGIDTNDLKTKARKAREFLAAGDKVKVVVRFRGREVTHKHLGHEVMKSFMAEIGESKTEKPLSDVGKEISILLAPATPKPAKV